MDALAITRDCGCGAGPYCATLIRGELVDDVSIADCGCGWGVRCPLADQKGWLAAYCDHPIAAAIVAICTCAGDAPEYAAWLAQPQYAAHSGFSAMLYGDQRCMDTLKVLRRVGAAVGISGCVLRMLPGGALGTEVQQRLHAALQRTREETGRMLLASAVIAGVCGSDIVRLSVPGRWLDETMPCGAGRAPPAVGVGAAAAEAARRAAEMHAMHGNICGVCDGAGCEVCCTPVRRREKPRRRPDPARAARAKADSPGREAARAAAHSRAMHSLHGNISGRDVRSDVVVSARTCSEAVARVHNREMHALVGNRVTGLEYGRVFSADGVPLLVVWRDSLRWGERVGAPTTSGLVARYNSGILAPLHDAWRRAAPSARARVLDAVAGQAGLADLLSGGVILPDGHTIQRGKAMLDVGESLVMFHATVEQWLGYGGVVTFLYLSARDRRHDYSADVVAPLRRGCAPVAAHSAFGALREVEAARHNTAMHALHGNRDWDAVLQARHNRLMHSMNGNMASPLDIARLLAAVAAPAATSAVQSAVRDTIGGMATGVLQAPPTAAQLVTPTLVPPALTGVGHALGDVVTAAGLGTGPPVGVGPAIPTPAAALPPATLLQAGAVGAGTVAVPPGGTAPQLLGAGSGGAAGWGSAAADAAPSMPVTLLGGPGGGGASAGEGAGAASPPTLPPVAPPPPDMALAGVGASGATLVTAPRVTGVVLPEAALSRVATVPWVPPGTTAAIRASSWPVPGPGDRNFRALAEAMVTSDLGIALAVGGSDPDATTVGASDLTTFGASFGQTTVKFWADVSPVVAAQNLSRYTPTIIDPGAPGGTDTESAGAASVVFAGGGALAAATADASVVTSPDIAAVQAALAAAGAISQGASLLRTPAAGAPISTLPVAFAAGAATTWGSVPHSVIRPLLKALINVYCHTMVPETPGGLAHVSGWSITGAAAGIDPVGRCSPGWGIQMAEGGGVLGEEGMIYIAAMTSAPFTAALNGTPPTALATWLAANPAWDPSNWGATDSPSGVGIAFVTRSEWSSWTEMAGPATLRLFATALPVAPTSHVLTGPTDICRGGAGTMYFTQQASRTVLDVAHRVLIVITDVSDGAWAPVRNVCGVAVTPGTLTIAPTEVATDLGRTCWYGDNSPSAIVVAGSTAMSSGTRIRSWHASMWADFVARTASMSTLATVAVLFSEVAYAARCVPSAGAESLEPTAATVVPAAPGIGDRCAVTTFSMMRANVADYDESGATARWYGGIGGQSLPVWSPSGVPLSRRTQSGLPIGRRSAYASAGWRGSATVNAISWGYAANGYSAVVGGGDAAYCVSMSQPTHYLPYFNIYTNWLLFAGVGRKEDVVTSGTRVSGLWGLNVYALACQSAVLASRMEAQHSYEMCMYQANQWMLQPTMVTIDDTRNTTYASVFTSPLPYWEALVYTGAGTASDVMLTRIDATMVEGWRRRLMARVYEGLGAMTKMSCVPTDVPWSGVFWHAEDGLGAPYGSVTPLMRFGGSLAHCGMSARFVSDMWSFVAGVLPYRPPLCSSTLEVLERLLRLPLLGEPRALADSGTFGVAVSQLSGWDAVTPTDRMYSGFNFNLADDTGTQLAVSFPHVFGQRAVSFGFADRAAPAEGVAWRALMASAGRAVGATASVAGDLDATTTIIPPSMRVVPEPVPWNAASLIMSSASGLARYWSRLRVGVTTRVPDRYRLMYAVMAAATPPAYALVDSGAEATVFGDTPPCHGWTCMRDVRVRVVMASDATPLVSVQTSQPPAHITAAPAAPPLTIIPATDPASAAVAPF